MKDKTMQAVEQMEPIRKGFFPASKMRLLTMVMCLVSLLSMSAFAADGDPVSISSLLTEAGTTIPQLATLAWNVITSNPLTTCCVVVLLASLGFRLLSRARHVVH